MNKKVYKITINDTDETGVFAASLVDFPAIEVDWVALSKNQLHEVKLSVNEDKQLLTGPLMIPNQMIERFDFEKKEPYYIFATKEDIERISQKFFKKGFQNATTHQHLISLANNTVVESWIIADSNVDKAKQFGFNLPVGTWMITVKVDDKEYWESNVKTGIVKGFSLEGFFVHVETTAPEGVELSKNNLEMDKNKTLLEKIRVILSEIEPSKEEKMETPMDEKPIEDPKKEEKMETTSFTLMDGTQIAVDSITMEAPVVDSDGTVIGKVKVEIGEAPEVVVNPAESITDISSPEDVTLSKINALEEKMKTILSENTELKNKVIELSSNVKPVELEKPVIQKVNEKESLDDVSLFNVVNLMREKRKK